MSGFFQDLKKRKVVRAAGLYAVVSWVIIQVVETLFEALQLPAWTLPFLVVVLFTGFPVTLIFAWIYDKKPDGTLTVDRDTGDHRPILARKRTWFAAGGIIAGVALGFIVSQNMFAGKINESEVSDKSIAVLPFTAFAQDSEDINFADGIHDDILTQLSKIHELKVVSRTSVMEYKGTTKNIKQIAAELGVAHIIEGSVRRVGERVRIVSQLIKAATDEHLWAETYDRDYSDIFAIQTDVAKNIANAMKATLTPDEIKQIEKIPTTNMEAYDYYLKGKFYWENYFDYTGNFKAAELSEMAIELDPDFVQALVLATISHSLLYNVWEWDPSPERKKLAKRRLDKAMLLASEDPIVLHANAMYLKWVENNLDMARAYLRKTVEIMPNHTDAIRELGQIEQEYGNFDEALELYQDILNLDPSRNAINIDIGNIFWRNKDFDNAIMYFQKLIDKSPDLSFGYAIMAYALDGKYQSFDQADKILEKGLLILENPSEQFYLSQNYHALLKRDKSTALKSAAKLTGGNSLNIEPIITYETFGMQEQAIKEWSRIKEVAETIISRKNDKETLALYGYVLVCSGESEKGSKILEELYIDWGNDWRASFDYQRFLVFYIDAMARLGEYSKATNAVKIILSSPSQYTKWHFRTDPLFEKLKVDKEFVDLIKES